MIEVMKELQQVRQESRICWKTWVHYNKRFIKVGKQQPAMEKELVHGFVTW